MLTPSDFLLQAKNLLGLAPAAPVAPSEAAPRTAVSRAYYSLYHEALAHLLLRHNSDLVRAINRELERRSKPPLSVNRITLSDFESIAERENLPVHLMVASAIYPLDRVQSVNFRNFRDDRNEADYKLSLQYPTAKASTKVLGIELLINQIRML